MYPDSTRGCHRFQRSREYSEDKGVHIIEYKNIKRIKKSSSVYRTKTETSFNHLSNIQTYVAPLRGTHVADYRLTHCLQYACVHRRGSEVIFDDSYSMPNSHRLRLAWIFRKSYSLRHCLSDLFYSISFYYKCPCLSRCWTEILKNNNGKRVFFLCFLLLIFIFCK